MLKIAGIAVAFALSSGVALAQNAGGAMATPSTDEFVTKAAAGSGTEVEAGKLAAKKAVDKSVRAFGERMVKDHGKAGKDLMALLEKRKMTKPEEKPDAEGQSMLDSLGAATGADFDRRYVAAMVEDHDKDVRFFQAYADGGDNPEIKAFARKTLAVIKHHDEMIHQIDKKMSRTGSR